MSQTSSAESWSRLIRPAAPLSVALLQFSPPAGKPNTQGPLRDPFVWMPSASQPESESLVSEDEEEEDDEEESEEELLALRRDGWVCCSAAGFSAGEHKHTIKTMLCVQHLI